MIKKIEDLDNYVCKYSKLEGVVMKNKNVSKGFP